MKKSNKLSADLCKSKIYVSKKFKIDIHDPARIAKAELLFANLDTSKESYEMRIFLNNREANHNTEKNDKNGYAQSFFVFGHGSGCYGGPRHCDVPKTRGMYDMRPSKSRKSNQYIDVTDHIKKMLGKKIKEFTITVVPVLAEIEKSTNLTNVLIFDGLSISIKSK